MAKTNKATTCVDRYAATHLDISRLDRLPALARTGNAKMINGHVLGTREAIMRFDTVEGVDAFDTRAGKGVRNRAANVGKDIVGSAPFRYFLIVANRCCAVSPALYIGNVVNGDATTFRIVACFLGVRQKYAGCAVGNLSAILFPHPTLYDRIGLVILGEAVLGEHPLARLRIRIAFGVREVNPGDPGEVFLLQPKPFVVLDREFAEHVRPRKFNVSAFVTAPHSGCADEFRRLLARDVTHLLNADDGRQTVSPGLDICGSR